MLEEVLRYLNNRFDTDARGLPYGSVDGHIAIASGALGACGLLDGQWYWVEGSRLNDGLHRHPADDLEDEEFDGRIVFLAVPKAVSAIAEEAGAWCADNAAVIKSPLQSESFGGYSYTKAQASGSQAAWQAQFGARLRPWRKLSREWV
jgi:hypothetical protein